MLHIGYIANIITILAFRLHYVYAGRFARPREVLRHHTSMSRHETVRQNPISGDSKANVSNIVRLSICIHEQNILKYNFIDISICCPPRGQL